MKLFKKIIYYELFKNYISLFIMFFLFNNLIAFGLDEKSYAVKNSQKYGEIEEIFKQKSIPYNEYDKLSNQLKTFFGLYSIQSDTNYYPDLSIIDTSEALRERYKLELEDMTINKTNYKLKKEGLFKN